MPKQIRILHLEDDTQDTELVQAMLRAEGIASNCTRVETEDQFVGALESAQFDLILADYTLPRFHGRSALSIATENCPTVPFIFVSGTIGEEVAIESLKSGATDYVLKQQMSRLVPAVRRALKEADELRKRKEAEAELRESEERAGLIMEKSLDAVITIDTSGVITNWNSQAETTFGWHREEILGKRLLETIIPQQYREAHSRGFDRFLSTGEGPDPEQPN